MKNVIVLACASALAILTAQSATAQSLRDGQGPAERPPLSYKGAQYVDSRGCIFIRAGFGGSVTWVPRVSRGGKLLCGAKPSVVAGSETVDPRGEVQTKETTVAATPRVPAIKPSMGYKPAPTRTTAKVVSAPKPAAPVSTFTGTPNQSVRTTAKRTNGGLFGLLFNRNSRSSSAKTVTAPVKVVAAPAPAPTNTASTAVFLNTNAGNHAGGNSCGFSSPYMKSNGKHQVRCGSQSVHPSQFSHATAGSTTGYATGATASSGTTSGVYYNTAALDVAVPKGYAAVWDDGRLNPERGVGKLSVAVAQSLIWTNTVPHRLVDRNTGKDVTLKYSYLQYPYTDYAQQIANLKGVAPVSTTTITAAVQPAATAVYQQPLARARTERATAKITKPVTSKSGGYIQAGVFSDPAQAKRAIAALRAAGLPVKIGKTTRKGRPVQILITWPYASNTNLSPILAQVKRAGFPTAVIK